MQMECLHNLQHVFWLLDAMTILFKQIIKHDKGLAHESPVSAGIAATMFFSSQSCYHLQGVFAFSRSHLPQRRAVTIRAIWIADLFEFEFGHRMRKS